MTLTTRLSLFFLAALAVVLAAFSGALYGLAHVHLSSQLDQQLRWGLDTLTVAVEAEPDGLEWEAEHRRLGFSAAGAAPLVWGVYDERGGPVDGSEAVNALLAAPADPQEEREHTAEEGRWQGRSWRVARRTLRSDAPAISAGHHRALMLAVAAPLDPVRSTLRTLAGVLALLSLGTWLSAALVGRVLCRRALAPVARMARVAGTISAADLGRRLPGPGTGDELEELGRAFNDLLNRLQDSFERQRRFTGEASHQLRTPLTAMLGQVEVALRRERTPEEYRRVLGLVQKQAVQLRQLIEMLLFLARADAEAPLPQRERLDLGAWLPEHLETWGQHSRRGDIQCEVCGGPLLVRVHPGLLGQAVDNLLDNACKYSAAGTPVVLRAWEEGGIVGLAVEDRGCGIAAEDLPHVFEPFFRSPEARRRGIAGAGLGLAVTARIVAAFGGRIEAAGRPAGGSAFVIRLSCTDGAAGGGQGGISSNPR